VAFTVSFELTLLLTRSVRGAGGGGG
jgi:hypothetical protein